MKFDRTEAGFANAHATATRMANDHKRSYVVAVFADTPNHYTLIMASLFRNNEKLVDGTNPMFIDPEAK